jgi:hypothetical protein
MSLVPSAQADSLISIQKRAGSVPHLEFLLSARAVGTVPTPFSTRKLNPGYTFFIRVTPGLHVLRVLILPKRKS